METFTWANHKVETNYPDSSTRVQFGGGYQFAAPPSAPDQRIFKLYFTGFRYYVGNDGQTVDFTTGANVDNMGALEQFYQARRLYDQFIYPHPVWGSVIVRFARPLQVPKGIAGARGLVEDFTVELVEQP